MLGHGETRELNLHARDYWKVVRNRWPVALLCFGLAFLTALTITYMTPQKFRGQVLIDSPPVLGVSDASVLAGAVDGVVLVVQHGKLPAALLSKAKTAVERAGGDLLGSVLNNVDLRSDSEYQYYTSYYTYHTPLEREKAPRAGVGAPAAASRPRGAVQQPGETASRY